MPDARRLQAPPELFVETAKLLMAAYGTYKELLGVLTLSSRNGSELAADELAAIGILSMEIVAEMVVYSRLLDEVDDDTRPVVIQHAYSLFIDAFVLLRVYSEDPQLLNDLPLPTLERVDDAVADEDAYTWLRAHLPVDAPA